MPLTDEALAAVDPRFRVDERKLDRLERLVESYWPEAIAPADLADPELWAQCANAHAALLAGLSIKPDELGF